MQSVQVNKQLSRACSVKELKQLLEEASSLSAVNISTAASRLAKLSDANGMPADPALQQFLVAAALAALPSFQGRQLSNFMWAISKLGGRGDQASLQHFLLHADARACACLHEGLFNQPSELSILVWAFARIGYNPSNLVQGLAEADGGFHLSPHLHAFGPQEVANFSWACAKLQIRTTHILCPLASRACELVQESKPRDISVTLWSFARLGVACKEVLQLFYAVADQGSEFLTNCSTRDLANVCWACAKLRLSPNRLLESSLDMACTVMHKCDAQSISNIMWAIGQMDCLTPRRLEAVTKALGKRAHSFTPQGLANALSALAMSATGVNKQANLHAAIDIVAAAAAAKAPELDHQNLSNIMWAVGTLGHQSFAVEQMVDLIIGECCKTPHNFTSQGLSNILWGFAKLYEGPQNEAECSGELLDALLPCAVARASSFGAQDISQTVWACARLKRCDARLLSALEKRMIETIEDFTAQGISNVVWGYASLGVYSSSLMDAVAIHAPRVIHDFSGQGLANLVWAYAQLDYVKPQRLLDAVAREATPRLGSFSAMTICSLVTSFAELYYPCLPLFDAVDDVVLQRLQDFQGPLAEKLLSSFSKVGYRSRAALPLLSQAAESTIQSLAYQTEGFKGSSRWSLKQRKHYTALMVEVFCSGGLPNMPSKQYERALPRLMKWDE